MNQSIRLEDKQYLTIQNINRPGNIKMLIREDALLLKQGKTIF